MEFRFGFIANAAEVLPDGRFFVSGGGIDVLGVPSVPFDFPALAVLARVNFGIDECNDSYKIGLTMTLPDGKESGLRIAHEVLPPDMDKFKDLGTNTDVAFSLFNIRLPQLGKYTFNLWVGDQRIGGFDFGVLTYDDVALPHT